MSGRRSKTWCGNGYGLNQLPQPLRPQFIRNNSEGRISQERRISEQDVIDKPRRPDEAGDRHQRA